MKRIFPALTPLTSAHIVIASDEGTRRWQFHGAKGRKDKEILGVAGELAVACYFNVWPRSLQSRERDENRRKKYNYGYDLIIGKQRIEVRTCSNHGPEKSNLFIKNVDDCDFYFYCTSEDLFRFTDMTIRGWIDWESAHVLSSINRYSNDLMLAQNFLKTEEFNIGT